MLKYCLTQREACLLLSKSSYCSRQARLHRHHASFHSNHASLESGQDFTATWPFNSEHCTSWYGLNGHIIIVLKLIGNIVANMLPTI